jgi:5-deoxy-D-glucuronate isomerase|tara:strand:+ start:1110 stop:1376 length:267 start_codon:yes stop_codon:yes gene_type:complete
MSSVRQKMAATQKAQNKSEEEARLGIEKVTAVAAEMLDDINKLSEEEVEVKVEAEVEAEVAVKKAPAKKKAAAKKAPAKKKPAPKGKK